MVSYSRVCATLAQLALALLQAMDPPTHGTCGASKFRGAYAAAGALALQGSLQCISGVRLMLPPMDARVPIHVDRTEEAVLSTTIPILRLLRNVSTIVYITSSDLHSSSWIVNRMVESRREVYGRAIYAIRTGSSYEVVLQEGTAVSRTTMGIAKCKGVVVNALQQPLPHVVCDFPDDPVCSSIISVPAILWFYPVCSESLLMSSNGSDDTAYYCRSYADAVKCKVIVAACGGLVRISDGDMSTRLLTSLDTYLRDVHDAPGVDGMCFSCTHLGAAIRKFCGEQHNTISTVEYKI